MAETAIEWATHVWNPVTGCDRISPGCDNCYALTLAARLKRMGQPRYQRDGDPRTSGPGFGLTLHEDKIGEPLGWRNPRTVFVNSMSDLFHKDVPLEFIGRVFNVMGSCPQHTFQVLTKRPKRMARALRAYYDTTGQEPFPNVWLGTSIEFDDYVWRADHLRAAPAAVRFISAEPLLGPLPSLDLIGIDWLIVGGESGTGHRHIDPEWVRGLRDAAQATRIADERPDCAFFFKQWGGRTPKTGGRELDGRTWDETP
jgi:protein gp37